MKLRSYWFLMFFLVMAVMPAVAQFEVSPDHFDDSPSNSHKSGNSTAAANLKRQIAEQKKLLASYQDRLVQKSAQVAKARQALANSGNATARNDLLTQKSELRELRQSLAAPVREAQLVLARLERQQQALRPSTRSPHARSTNAVLSAAK
jgi:predicted  nucleic acid-binding Zn-ribbon protein